MVKTGGKFLQKSTCDFCHCTDEFSHFGRELTGTETAVSKLTSMGWGKSLGKALLQEKILKRESVSEYYIIKTEVFQIFPCYLQQGEL